MVSNTIISTSEARKHLYSLIEQVGTYGQTFTLTKGGKAMAILINPDELESWIETSTILHDKQLMNQIQSGLQDIEEGNVYPLDQVRDEILT